jgi:hypothetical protein
MRKLTLKAGKGFPRQMPLRDHHESVEHVSSDKRPLALLAADDIDQRPDLPRDKQNAIFVKFEKGFVWGLGANKVWNILDLSHLDGPVDPRIISTLGMRYNLKWGRFIYPIEALLYAQVDAMWNEYRDKHGIPRHRTVCKCLNAIERGLLIAFILRTTPWCVGGDAKRFDQHVGEFIRRIESDLYKSCLILNRDDKAQFAELARIGEQYNVRTRFKDGFMTFRIKRGRKSGMLNTSVGNVWIASAMILAWARKERIAVDFIDDGDDFLLFFFYKPSAAVRARLVAHCLSWGFQVELEAAVDRLEDIEFCSSKPVINSEGSPMMVRKYPHCIFKDLTILHDYNMVEVGQHLRSIYDCGMALAADMPVLGAFYRWLGRLVGPGKRRKLGRWDAVVRLSRDVPVRKSVVTDDSRVSFAAAYGYAPGRQEELERLFESLPVKMEFEDLGSSACWIGELLRC